MLYQLLSAVCQQTDEMLFPSPGKCHDSSEQVELCTKNTNNHSLNRELYKHEINGQNGQVVEHIISIATVMRTLRTFQQC